MLEEFKTKLENNQLLPDIADKPQKANFISLDGLKLNDRQTVREQVMKELEKDIVSIKQDLARRGIKSKIDQPDANEEQDEPNSRPGSKSIRNLTLFSSDSTKINPVFQKQAPGSSQKPWSVPFNLNRPPFPDLDLQNEQKYKQRDPRHQLKYFSFDSSSQDLSRDHTHISNLRLKHIGEQVLRASAPQSATIRKADEVRADIERRIQDSMQRKFAANAPLASKVDLAYKLLLSEDKLP